MPLDRYSKWTVKGIKQESQTIYLNLEQSGEGGGGIRKLEIPWRSASSLVNSLVPDPVIGQTIELTIKLVPPIEGE